MIKLNKSEKVGLVMKYKEEMKKTSDIKSNYLKGIENLISKRISESEKIRTEYVKSIFKETEKYRGDLKNLMGWPLNDENEFFVPECKLELVSQEEDFDIYRAYINVIQDIKFCGLLFKKRDSQKRPLITVLHGTLGSPELVAGFYDDKGSYNSLIERVLQYNVNVFAPQLLIWHTKDSFRDYGVTYDRDKIDSQLKMTGSSVVSVEVFSLMQALNYFEKEEYVSTFGMIGHSTGGFYTLFTAALDTRITASVCNAYFNNCTKVIRPEWMWQNSALKFCNAEVAALVYPRKIFFQMGNNDILFDYKDTIKEFERLKTFCKDIDTDWTDLLIFEGIHEFAKDDSMIERLINECLREQR